MPAALPATELLDARADGRIATRRRTVRLGDVDSRGRLRLDATARYLQDVATDDVGETPLGQSFTWVVRRTLIEVRRPAVLGEELTLATFCSGTGRCWAERRTSIVGSGGGSIETVGLWVRIDPSSGRPLSLTPDFTEVYGPAAGGRKVSARLGLPSPAADATTRPWPIRRVDIDPLGHVNNAAHWAALEEVCAAQRCPRRGVAEIEFLTPLDFEARVELRIGPGASREGATAWLVNEATTYTALRWTTGSGADGGGSSSAAPD
jgi:acyl-ACP thioesterase